VAGAQKRALQRIREERDFLEADLRGRNCGKIPARVIADFDEAIGRALYRGEPARRRRAWQLARMTHGEPPRMSFEEELASARTAVEELARAGDLPAGMTSTLNEIARLVGVLAGSTKDACYRLENEVGALETEMRIGVERLDAKVDGVEAKIDRLETKFDRLETRVEGIENRVTALENAPSAADES
jgi:predicted RNase H-like nuclease (RuvC/YqgF family)